MGFHQVNVDLKEDQYLNGRVTVFQPVKGYRAGTDAVMLAAAVDAKAGSIGYGTGVWGRGGLSLFEMARA